MRTGSPGSARPAWARRNWPGSAPRSAWTSGPRTPEETAVSVAAELIQLRWGGTGQPLTDTAGRIHHRAGGSWRRLAGPGGPSGMRARVRLAACARQLPGCCWPRARDPARPPQGAGRAGRPDRWSTGLDLPAAPGGADPCWSSPVPPRCSLPSGILTVYNPDWRSGMGSSLVPPALRRLTPATAAPRPRGRPGGPAAGRRRAVTAPDRRLPGRRPVAVAAYDGQPRNPVLLAREHWPEVIELAAGDVGARPFLRARPDLVTLVECGDIGRPDDVDTPDDLARIAALDPGPPAEALLRRLDAPCVRDRLAGLAGPAGPRRSRRRSAGRSWAPWPAPCGGARGPAGRR